MSIARAFTTRRVKESLELRDAAEGMHRSNTTHKSSGSLSIRHKISAPVELVSTTNMLSYNAPDIYPQSKSSPNSSTKSDDDSDSLPGSASASETPPTSPDSPHPAKRSISPEPNHLSCYFTAPGQAINAPTATEAPVIPQRAPSHVKKSYEALTRHRSTSRLSEQSARTVSSKSSFSFSRSSSTSTSTSATSHASSTFNSNGAPALSKAAAAHHSSSSSASAPPVSSSSSSAPHKRDKPSMSIHPFGHELAQVSELAEEFTPKETGHVADEEERELARKGLNKFSADDYLSEIQGLVTSIFGEALPVRTAMWI